MSRTSAETVDVVFCDHALNKAVHLREKHRAERGVATTT
jgi:hypothetical protein